MIHGNTLVDQPDEPRIKVNLRVEAVKCLDCGHEYETSDYAVCEIDDDIAYVFASCPECRHIKGSVELYQRPDPREHEGAKDEDHD
jgi:NAD-dependent SIR2 family protein deacetylase